MALDLFEIKSRIQDMLQAELNYLTVFETTPSPMEIMDNLPCVALFTGAFDAPLVSGTEARHAVNVDLYAFVRGISDIGTTIGEYEVDIVLQEVTQAFMTHLRLQIGTNDKGLPFIQGDIQFTPTVRPTSTPIAWPIGVQDAIPFYGFQSRLTVAVRSQYKQTYG